jgi:hypothetical protein
MRGGRRCNKTIHQSQRHNVSHDFESSRESKWREGEREKEGRRRPPPAEWRAAGICGHRSQGCSRVRKG